MSSRSIRLCVVLATLVTGCAAGPGDDVPASSGATLGQLLGGTAPKGFERALRPRPFRFPADHGAHPSFQTEWWYLTGNLATSRGRRFGYQLTIFRRALRPPTSDRRESQWATDQIYMAHFAVTDVEAQDFHVFERFARGAAGLAGATSDPLRVWLEDWSVDGVALEPLRVQLHAADIDDIPIAIDLELVAGKPHVLQGDAGLSAKGMEPGNASYYYSYTRLHSTGTVTIGPRIHHVNGSSWMDREWSTSVLSRDQVGWEWLSLQLDGDEEIMLFRLRDETGEPSFSHATRVDAAGNKHDLPATHFALTPTSTWNSPRDGASYPRGLALEIPESETLLQIEPMVADQELRLSVRYWEGAVTVTGTDRGRPTTGVGYVELTGYAR